MSGWLSSPAAAAAFLLLASCEAAGGPAGETAPAVAEAEQAIPAAAPAPAGESAGPLAAAAPAGLADAEPPSPALREHRLEPSGGEPFDHFGVAVAAGDRTVVAGARYADVAGTDSGAAYVFRLAPGGWGEEAKLVPADALEHDRFGNAVGSDSDTIVVGAPGHHDLGRRVGSAYVFRRAGAAWRQEARLFVDGLARFGHAVAISGDRVVVGAPGDSVNDLPAGAVYVFRRDGSTWRREERLTAGDAEAGDLFGLSVGISAGTVVAGAPGDDERGSLTGAAYVFVREGGGWRQEAKLLAEDAAALGEFGKVVAIDGDAIVAGAEGASDVKPPGPSRGAATRSKFAGAAYAFRRGTDGWRQEAKLQAADRRPGDRFGCAVAVHRETIAVGAHFADPAGLGSGAAYLFRLRQAAWRQEAKLVRSGAEAGEEFGRAVAVYGGTVSVGALRGSGASRSAGSVFVFEAPTSPP